MIDVLVKKDSQILKFLFLAGIFLLPLVYWSKAEIPYEIPKVWFFQKWVEVLGIVALWEVLKRKTILKREKSENSLVLWVFLFLLVAFVSSLRGVDFGKSFWGNYYRQDGLFTLFHLAGLFFFLNLFWDDSWRKPLILALSLGSFLTSVWTLALGFRLHFLGDLSVYRFGRAIGATFGQPNFLGGYLLITVPFLVSLFENNLGRRRWFWLSAMIFQIGAIFLTLSWGAIIGLVFYLAVTLVRKNLVFVFLAIFLLVGAVVKIWQPAKVSELYPESRTRIIVRGLIAFTQRPILGWGWANFDYAFRSVDWPVKFVNDVYVDKAHSNLLEVLTTTGGVGLIVYVAIVLLVLKKAWLRATNFKPILLVFLLFLFHSQTNVISIAEEMIFWLIIGIVSSI